jgi:hypothetical protein
LKPRPATSSITATASNRPLDSDASAVAIARSAVLPVSPYRSDMPYKSSASENAPRRKYLTAASFERRFGRRNPARM